MQFVINEKLHINLCICVRIFITLVYISFEAKANTCCRLYEVVDSVSVNMHNRLAL